MRQYGLIGASLGHSFSKKYFERKFAAEGRFDCRYDLFELADISLFRTFVEEHPDLLGVNVTIPYKQSVLPLLDAMDPEAESIGAVNTVRIFREAGTIRLVGYNTDVEGFRQSLAGQPIPGPALVLGAGGAAAAVTYVLRQWNVPYRVVSRRPKAGKLSYDALTPTLLADFRTLINCTPVGTFPNVEAKPQLPYNALTDKHFLYDLVYNPELTQFLKEGKERGCRVQNGLAMLHLQAEAAWNIWNAAKRTVCP